MAKVGIGALGSKRRYLEGFALGGDGYSSMRGPRFVHREPCLQASVLHVLPERVGCYVDVVHTSAHKGIAHASTHKPGFEPCSFKHPEHRGACRGDDGCKKRR